MGGYLAVDSSSVIGVITIVVQLIFLEGVLSIDNAAVLGALVSVLPADKPVPYPRALKPLQKVTDRVFGMQQMAALKVGLLGAYIGRGTMLVLATWIIENPILRILGAAYLIKLAFDQLSEPDEAGETEQVRHQHLSGTAFWLVVLNVELADLAFSLDNVVAAVALSNKLWVVMLGVALGILTMRFAAGLFTWAIKREPILATAAYIVVLNIGVELLLAEFFQVHFEAWEKFLVSAAALVLCVAYARLSFLHVLAPVFTWLAQGMGNMDELINWALRPVVLLVKLIFGLLAKPVRTLLDHSPSPLSRAVHSDAVPDRHPITPRPDHKS
jgi:tellurite resistance protein TerC